MDVAYSAPCSSGKDRGVTPTSGLWWGPQRAKLGCAKPLGTGGRDGMGEPRNPRLINKDLLASYWGLEIGEDPGVQELCLFRGAQPPCQPCPPSCAPYGTPSRRFGVTWGTELSRGDGALRGFCSQHLCLVLKSMTGRTSSTT